jgi:hypothetical protein
MAGPVRYTVLLDANDGDPNAVGMSACLGMLDSKQSIFSVLLTPLSVP